jgi:glycosyltransferase involved in cell wall biosynthesis
MVSELRRKLAGLCSWSGQRSRWRELITRNASFQKAAAKKLLELESTHTSRTVFAYSYAALEIFKLARVRGWRTVLGQMDPGPPEERIVAKLYDESPIYRRSWERAPAEYWSSWREECLLADRVVVNSPWTQAALEEEGVPATKIRIVPLAYEHREPLKGFRREYPLAFTASRPLRVLFLGQINLRKGIGPLLDAVRLLRGEPVEFSFVGPTQIPIPSDLRNNPQVCWVGSIHRNDTARFYRDADVFLFPTFSDGFGLTQLEAQAWKLPIIATRFCGDVVEDGRNGWVLSEISASVIAAAVRRCLADPARLQAFSAHSVPANQFSLDRLGQKWLRLFE